MSSEERPPHPPDEGPEERMAHEGKHPAEAEVERLRADVEAARREAADHLEKARRALADFDNFRRRAREEQQRARESARSEFLGELLAVIDNFDRALDHADDEEGLYEGVKLIYRQLGAILEKHGLVRINTEGHAFDPNVHEAVMREPTREYAEGTIIRELERGYLLGGKVLRPAKVKVAVAPDESKPPPGAGDSPA